MQTFKDRSTERVKKQHAHHQRSQSLCQYGEFSAQRDPSLHNSDTEFRQRRPLLADNELSVEERTEFNKSTNPNLGDQTCPLATSPECYRMSSDCCSELKCDSTIVPELSCLLQQQQCRAIVSGATSNPTSPANMPSSVKGHRRSLSLRQRFEGGYEYIVSEIEHAREVAEKTVNHARVVAEKTVIHASSTIWKVCHFNHLPNWMQDNEYLHGGHRPPLPSLWACAKSVFRVHTETGNIWTHGIGALLFLGLFIYEFVTISAHKTATDRLMLAIYFCGIILCLIFSTLFHTFSCYASPKVIKVFSKLDYCGISLQIIGSMIPALYYGFYENIFMFKIYITFGIILCILSIVVSMWDKFGEPKYRSLRAIVFLTFGLSNVVPGVHWYIVLDSRLMLAFGLFIFQGALYVIGSLLYANRIPERFFPGKCDYLFQSHQIFHVLVVLAALVHLNGINSMADFRLGQLAASATISPITSAPVS